MKRRILSIILTLAMCLSLLPAMTVTASAAAGVKYQICDENGRNWKTAIRRVYTNVTSGQTQWTGGWYVAERDVTLTGKTVTVIGDVHLILKNGCRLTITGAAGVEGSDGSGGISILNGSSLTVYGQAGQSGELRVIGGDGGGGGTGGGDGGDGGSAVNGSLAIYGGNVTVTGGRGGDGGNGGGSAAGIGGNGGNGGNAVSGSVAVCGGAAVISGGSGGDGGGSSGMGRGPGGGDGKAVTGSVTFSDGYVHLTQAGPDENTAEVMEWTGASNGFPLAAKWVKIQPMRVNGVTVTPAAAKVKPGETVEFTAKITVLSPTGVEPLIVTKGVTWSVTGGKTYVMTDGQLTVRATETAKALTVTAKFGADTGSAGVTVEQAPSPEQLTGVKTIGDTTVALPTGGTTTTNPDGTMSVPGSSIIIPPVGPSITVSHISTVDENGNVSLSGGCSATIRGSTVTVPAKGGTLSPNGNGTISIPSGSVVTDRNGKRIAVPPRGGTISLDGTYTENPDSLFTDTPPTYPPTISKPVNGYVSVAPRSPRRGDTVVVFPAPDGGFEVDAVVVRDSRGHNLEVKDNLNGSYSFTQPGETVIVEVTFAPQTQTLPFFDVLPGDWCYDAVLYVNSKGIMGGYSNGFFQPNTQLTRAMLAQILYNLAGGVSEDYQIQYKDVPAGAWYAEAVRWAAGKGIVTGYSDGSFRPAAPITREQFAVMLYRFYRSQGGDSAGEQALNCADADQFGGYAREAAAWCAANNILGGYGDGTLRPKGQTTRAQAAVMLTRFCKMS